MNRSGSMLVRSPGVASADTGHANDGRDVDAGATLASLPSVAKSRGPRLLSIDLVRGLVMVLMTLDHTGNAFTIVKHHATDLSRTTVPLFFTRWVTHFCAPAFVLLAGMSIYLVGRRKGKGEHARFLVSRGLFLVVLELTVVKFGFAPEPFYYVVVLQVIWAIGWSMVAMAGLVYLPSRAVGALAALMLLSAPLWEGPFEGAGAWPLMQNILAGRGRYEPLPGHTVYLGYALLPWLAVMMLGYGLGELCRLPRPRFRRAMLTLGALFTVAFIGLRALNAYGDPRPWSTQPEAMFTLLSFLNTQKYPPSLLYLLMTLGPVLIAIALLDRVDPGRPWARALATFGRVPLFFYVAHLWLIALASLLAAIAVWGVAGALSFPPEGHAGNPEWPLPAAWAIWLLVLALLYRPSRACARFKRRRRDWWLSYL